jgi:hypothetical protein
VRFVEAKNCVYNSDCVHKRKSLSEKSTNNINSGRFFFSLENHQRCSIRLRSDAYPPHHSHALFNIETKILNNNMNPFQFRKALYFLSFFSSFGSLFVVALYKYFVLVNEKCLLLSHSPHTLLPLSQPEWKWVLILWETRKM